MELFRLFFPFCQIIICHFDDFFEDGLEFFPVGLDLLHDRADAFVDMILAVSAGNDMLAEFEPQCFIVEEGPGVLGDEVFCECTSYVAPM